MIEYVGQIEQAILARLRDQLPGDPIIIDAWAGNPLDYTRRPTNNFAVLVRYAASEFVDETLSATGEFQSHLMEWNIFLLGVSPRDHRECWQWLAILRALIHGWNPLPDTNPNEAMTLTAQENLVSTGPEYFFSQTYRYRQEENPPAPE